MRLREWLKEKDKTKFDQFTGIYTNAVVSFLRFTTIEGYPFHGQEHCDEVERLLDELIPDRMKEDMASEEIFILLCGVVYHDFGMSNKDDRPIHNLRSRDYVWNNCDKISGLSRPEANIVKDLCYAHRDYVSEGKRIRTLFEIPKEDVLQGNIKIRVRLLTALLRLADELDTTYSRAPEDVMGMIKLSDNDIAQWITHNLIKGVKIDADRFKIWFNPFMELINKDNTGQYKKLICLRRDKIQQELDSMQGIFEDTPIGYEFIKFLVDFEGTHNDFNFPVIRDLDSSMTKIYSFSIPVRNSTMFYGRQEEKEEILKGLNNALGDSSYAVIGGRRMGKTSLLLEIERRLLKRLKFDENLKIIPAYLDLNYLVPHTRRLLLIPSINRLMGIIDEYFNISIDRVNLRIYDETRPDRLAVDDFADSLKEIFKITTPKIGNIRIALLIDEIEQVIGESWIAELFPQLRALLTNCPISNHIVLVLTGTKKLYKVVHERGSPLENVLVLKRLKVLNKDESLALINEPTEGVLNKSVAEEIYLQTGGHPFLIQYIMKNLGEMDLKEITREDLHSILERFLQERNDFNDWLKRFNKIDKEIYSLLIDQQIHSSFREIKEGVTKREILAKINKPEAVKESLDFLCHIGVTEVLDSNRYVIAGRMFRDWWKDNVRL